MMVSLAIMIYSKKTPYPLHSYPKPFIQRIIQFWVSHEQGL